MIELLKALYVLVGVLVALLCVVMVVLVLPFIAIALGFH